MQYQVTHRTTYHYTVPVSVCHNLVRLAPRNLPGQSLKDFELQVTPEPITRTRRLDYFGNQVDYFTIQEAHHELEISAQSVVHRATTSAFQERGATWNQVAELIAIDRNSQSLEAYFLSLPTKLAPDSAALRSYALESFADRRPILDAVQELVARIHTDFVFDPHATTVQTPAVDLLTLRRGVCQDFAHFAIGCLRSLGLAARYVSGYVCTSPPPGSPRLVGADASHAWFSVYTGADGWVDFDPTNNLRAGNEHITLAWGRDYGDICPIQGVFVGGGVHTMFYGVDVIPVSESSAKSA